MSLFDKTNEEVQAYVPGGMKGLSALSTDERDQFENSLNPEQKKWSDVDKNAIYFNRKFINKYGHEAFLNTSYEDRLKQLNSDAVKEEAEKRFGNYSNWEEISGLSETGLKRLLISDYVDPENEDVNVHSLSSVWAEEDKKEKEERKKRPEGFDTWSEESKYAYINSLEGSSAAHETVKGIKRLAQSWWTGLKEKHNAGILESAKSYADKDILGSKEYKENYYAIKDGISSQIQSGAISQKDFDDAFEEFANATYTTFDVQGNAKEVPMFAQYTGRKDETTFGIKTDLYALEEPEKRAIYSKYLALQQTLIKPEMTEKEKAQAYSQIIDMINRDFETRADEKETAWSNSMRVYKSIGTKLVSQFSTEMLGFYFLSLNPEEQANFIAGKDKEGNDLPWYFNMKYWNNVDMYNAWTPEQHNKIERNAGVSEDKLTVAPDAQGDWLTTENFGEAVGMTGYIAQSVLQDLALRGAGKLAKSAMLSQKLGAVGRLNRKVAQNAIVQGVGNFTGKAIRANMAAFPETMMEGVSIYDETFNEIQSKFQDKLQNDQEYNKKLTDELETRLSTSMQNAISGQQRITDPEGKTVGFQVLPQIPIYDITGQTDQPLMFATSEKEAYDIYRQMILDREWKDNEEAARESATKAALATMAGFQLKNAVIGAVFEDFKFSKRLTPSGFDYRQLADGTFRMNKKFATHFVGSTAKQIAGGFIDETTDSYVEQFGSAYGLNDANNYMNKKYGTNVFTDGLNEISNLQAAAAGLGGAMMDPEAYKEGFIGAMAPMNTHVNPVGIVQYSRMTKEQRAALSTLEKMNQFIYNPLLQSATNDYREYKGLQDEIAQLNKFVSEHKGDYEDILSMLAAHQRMYNANDANAAQNAKDDVAFEFISTIAKLRAKNATQAQAFTEELNRLANGEITNEDIAQFFAYGDNSQLQQQKGSQAEAIARDQIQQNAEGLLDKIGQYEKIENDFIVEFGDYHANPELKDLHDQVTYMQMQSYGYQKRIKQLREKLGLNTEVTDEGNFAFTEQQSKALVEAYEKDLNNAEQSKKAREYELSVLEEKLSKAQERLKREKNAAKRQAIGENIQDYQQQIQARKNALEIKNDVISEMKDKIKGLKENKLYADGKVNQEFLKSLSGRTLSYLLSDKKIAQQLKNLDPLFKEHLQDITRMEEGVKNNDYSLKLIKQNPKAFSAEMMKFKLEQLSKIAQDYRQRQLANDLIEYKKKGLESLRKMSSQRISQVGEYLTGQDKQSVEQLAGAVQVHEDAMVLLQEKYSQNQESMNNWQKTLQTIIGNANSKEEAYKQLEEAANNAGFDQNLQKQLATLYKDLTGIDITRQSTKPKTDEGKQQNKKSKQARTTEQTKQSEKKNERVKAEEERKKQEEKKKEEEKKNEEEKKDNSEKLERKQLFDEEGNFIAGTEDLNFGEEEKKPESVTSEEVESDQIKADTEITPVLIGQEEQPVENSKFKKQDSPTEMQGNAMYRYDVDTNGQMIERKPAKKGGAFEALLSWCKANNIDYQSIIDNELSKFLNKNTPIYIMYANSNMEGAANMKNVPLLCVEFTDAIAKKMRAYDKGEKGGVFDFNGKRYLMIGNLGFSNAKTEAGQAQAASYYNCRNLSLNKSQKHFKENPDSRVFVDTDYSTRMTKVNTGGLVRQIGEEKRQYRKLSELLEDSKRNPRGLSWSSLNFAVSRLLNGTLIIGNVNPSQVYSLQQEAENNGNTFLLLQNANGMYVPVYIQPRFIQDESFKNGDFQLKTDIENTIRKLASQDYNDRLQAVKELSQMLVLSDSGLNILIGTEKVPTVSIVDGNQVMEKFNLTSSDFSAQQLIDYIMNQCNFRVNVSAKSLTDEYMLKKLDEAGALTTDIAYLGFMNASFTVAGVDAQGNMLAQEEQKPAQRTETNNRANSVMINKKVYRKEGKQWVDDLGTPIIDQSLIDQCELNQTINNLGEHKMHTQGRTEFHVLDEANNVVVRRNGMMQVEYMSKEGAANIINTINQKIAEQNAKNALMEQERKREESKKEEDKPKPNQQEKEKKIDNPLKNPKNSATFAFDDLLNGLTAETADAFGNLADIILEKVNSGEWQDFPIDNPEQYEEYLNKKGIATVGITNLQDWLKNIKECK